MPPVRWWIAAVVLGFGATTRLACAASGDLADRIIILANSAQPDSVELARFYARERQVPLANIIVLPMSTGETITWPEFVATLWEPLQDELVKRDWLVGVTGKSRDSVGRREAVFSGHHLSYLVVCRGTPLRIQKDLSLIAESATWKMPEAFRNNEGAVDSELSLLAAGNYEINGFVPNPLFQGKGADSLAGKLVIKVSRLDGPTDADARALVTSALTAERDGIAGRYYIDLRTGNSEGDDWLEKTAHELDDLGFEGDVEHTSRVFSTDDRFDAPLFYFGWYALNCVGPFMRENFRFPPGAIALHIHSNSAETLRSGDHNWCGPFIARGVTATMGNVFEPYLEYTHRPDIFMRALARGATLGDAAYESLPVLSWQAVLVGDPLYRPFRAGAAMHLPTDLQAYDWIRQACKLERAGKPDAADALLSNAFSSLHHAALAVTRANLEFSRGYVAAGKTALESIADHSEFSAGEWPALREAARLLEKHDDVKGALALYEKWVHASAPDAAWRLSVFSDAIAAARKSGDETKAREFERLRDQ
ncbi:MAG TPA: TIGR03790 family protein [Candidatus Didemnitutus sp.]|nr:TIGR03790 family protein [Candidatus Didemnitutus sp.]